jgi:hypothetical protein
MNSTGKALPAVIEGTSHDFLTDAFRAQADADVGAIRADGSLNPDVAKWTGGGCSGSAASAPLPPPVPTDLKET